MRNARQAAGFPLTKQGKGSPKDWKLCKAEFGYTSDAKAGEKAPKPCDGMLPAIQAGVLLMSRHGTTDSVVAYEDNAAPLIKAYYRRRLSKPGFAPCHIQKSQNHHACR